MASTANPFVRPRPVAEQTAYEEGRKSVRFAALDFLHSRYMDRDLDPNDPVAKAILQLAKELSEHLRGLP